MIVYVTNNKEPQTLNLTIGSVLPENTLTPETVSPHTNQPKSRLF